LSRRSGTGRGRKPTDKKDGHGKGNWGDKPDGTYKRKGDVEEEKVADANEEVKAEEVVEEKPPKVEEPKVEYVEEIIGYSLDEVLANKKVVGRKEARAAEGIKGQKVQEVGETKTEKASTLAINQLKQNTYAKTADATNAILGFGGVKEEEQLPVRGRGAPRGRGGAQGGRPTGGRKNAKQALKITDEDFPALV